LTDYEMTLARIEDAKSIDELARALADSADQCCYQAGAWWREQRDLILEGLKKARSL
jgi:hypothetical protein